MYKLIAVDMDGTLLKEDKTISDTTKKAISNAQQKGVKVVLASGRPIEGLTKYLEELDLLSEEDYVLSFNGSIVQNTKTKQVIRKHILKGEDLFELYKIARQIGVNIHAFSNEGCITPKMSKYSELEGTINGIPVIEMDYKMVDQSEDIIKIMMVDEPEVLEEAIKKLPEYLYQKYTVVRSAPYFLEFLNKRSSKGVGIKALSDHLGIKKEQIICIGDAGNDLDMIKFAGLGVAMGNAFEEVKAAADYITKNNQEDGVAHVIRKFVLAG
ncbi:sugar-phosphatase [Cellulosilyticum sp. I15G10I2]|uniref:sugar-phosphatase n=1 Tax=Cellulosilyticum sp. I15G10I2 TaxID=1892843 RepID=UPI00085BD326|nr:sugar-phosphatase [Cellulosilyticum sp. I15G10I2]